MSTENRQLSGAVDKVTKIMPNPTIRWSGDPSRLPRISIVTPCFNHAEFVEATILSILEQGYPNLEYIVMDGGSTDGSVEIIRKYEPYLVYWQSQPDGGQYYAINEGLQHTTGEIMAWLNSDDMLCRNSLWTVAEIFEVFREIEWLMGYPVVYDSRGRYIDLQKAIPRWSRYRFLRDFRWIMQEGVVWRRSLWEKAGSHVTVDYKYAGDVELWARFFRHAPLYTTTAFTGGFRFTPNQRSQAYRDQYLEEAERILAAEKMTPAEERVMNRIKLFDRYLPFVMRKVERLKRVYDNLFQFPPYVAFDANTQRFVLKG